LTIKSKHHSIKNQIWFEKNNRIFKEKRNNENKNDFSGYPIYPDSENIYSKSKKEMNVNSMDNSKIKVLNEKTGTSNEKDFNDDESGSDLDFPGLELDDENKKGVVKMKSVTI
jgi:hypothetical protein